jgi:amino acid permease
MTKRYFMIAAIVTAATIGEGVFALPYVIQTAGWLITFCYFIALTAVISIAHNIYLRTLSAVKERERLLGLTKKYFGTVGFWIGFIAIVVGLLLGFLAYLVLGTRFLAILFPAIPSGIALALFWLLLACLIWGSEGTISGVETIGITLIALTILFIFFSGHPAAALTNMPVAVSRDAFLPFGAVLFALAGWTSVEQVYELSRSRLTAGRNPDLLWVFVGGTAAAGFLYWLFALGVIGSSGSVSMDTISGITAWPLWRKDILAIVGLLSVCVISLPLAREIRGAMEKDLRWNSIVSRAVIIFLPIAAVLAGFNNFLEIVSVAGGIFLSAQYCLIISVGRRTLALSNREKILLDVIALVFICAAVYSVYAFVVR